MFRSAISALTLTLAFTPSFAAACSFVLPPLPELATKVATTNVIIRATVIQAFDAKKEQAEILRADRVYIGDTKLRKFEIYTTKSDFKPRTLRTSCDWSRPSWKVGDIIDWLVLTPIKSTSRKSADRRWQPNIFAGALLQGEGLNLLVSEAKRAGTYNGDR